MLSGRHLGNVGSRKEKRIWVIREKEIKAKRKSRKRHSLVRRTNERRKMKRKKRRTNRCPVLPRGAFASVDPEMRRAMPRGLRTASLDPKDVHVMITIGYGWGEATGCCTC